MAMESQGIRIRRQSTAAGSTGTSSGAVFNATSSTSLTRSDAGNFITAGFTTGMRFEILGTTMAPAVYTVKAVTATTINTVEAMSTFSSSIGNLTIVGHAFTDIGQVTGFNGPTGSAAVIDITVLNSTAKEKMVGIRDEGQVTLDINLNTSADQYHNALRADRALRSLRVYDIMFTDQTTAAGAQPSFMNFDAYVTGFQINGSVDNVVKGSVTLELTSSVKTQSPAV